MKKKQNQMNREVEWEFQRLATQGKGLLSWVLLDM